jgi:PIN domain nuclease of toxin-antitoxin system
VLLDTHVWVWAVDGGAKLGPKIRRRLARAAAEASPDVVCVSSGSVLEIAALHTAGRLQFNRPVERWIRESIDRGRLRVLDIDRDIAIDAGLIPAAALADPIDRCLVATARGHDLALVTADRAVLDYSRRTGLVKTIDASV